MKTKFIITLLLLVGELSYAQLFQQDFSSSTSVNSYVNATSPTANQLNSISNFGNAPSTITNNALRFSKKGASSAFFVRTTPMAAVAPDFVKFQFKIKISEPVTLDNYTNCNAALYLGDGTDVGFSDPTQVTAPVAASIHTKLDIKLVIAAGSAKFAVNGKEYSGEQIITLFINNTDDTIPKHYTTPGGYKATVAKDKFDIWIGNDLVINEGSATTATANINKFKFILPSCAPNAIIDIDNIEIRGDAAESSALWLSTVKYQVPSSEIYLGSPSILKLTNGDILVTHDYFGAKGYRDAQGRSNRTSFYKSADNGQTWSHLTDLSGAYWANLFEHKGAVYLLGTTSANGSIAIRKSTDGGLTWTQPINATTGLLFNEGTSGAAPRYHGAPTPIAKAGGRLYRAFENVEDLTAAGFRGYRTFVISIDENDDLLDATKWTKSNELTFNGTWDPPGSAGTTGWIEGNAVVGTDGNILNMLRVNSTPFFGRSALQTVSNNGQTIGFNASSDFINFPGGSCKFVVRKDPVTHIYWAMLNDNTNGVESNQRNVLALYASSDLRNWYHAKRLIEDNQGYTATQSIALTGFQYPDWQFDGNDIIYLSRTAYGDGVPRAHDSNYITFGRVENYMDYIPDILLETLPLKGLEFSGKRSQNIIELKWKNNLKQVSSFTVYKLDQNQSFKLLKTIEAGAEEDYRFIDYYPIADTNIYKLGSIDKNGKLTEEITSVDFRKSPVGLRAVKLTDGKTISVFMDASEAYSGTLMVSDMQGRLLYKKQMDIQQGSNTLEVSAFPVNSLLLVTWIGQEGRKSIILP